MTRLALLVASALLISGCGGQNGTNAPVEPSQSPSQSPSPSSSPSSTRDDADGLPPKSQWLADVSRAMRGSRAFLDARLKRAGTSRQKLAINLDIDNTALASQYDFGAPVPDVLQLAREAQRRGVTVLFNTARFDESGARQLATQQLERAGYPVTEVCLRGQGEGVAEGKQRCRRHFVDEGYTLIASIGNNDTDFVGGDYERAFRLPNYGRLS